MAKELKPAIAMVAVQIVFAVVNILYKLAVNDGMNLSVLVAYRHIFGAAVLLPLAVITERRAWPALTRDLLALSFLCGLLGGTVTQNLYLAAINLTTATYTTAIANLIPAITFILAVGFRLEKLNIGRNSGMAKLAGTLLGIGGATLLTFYKGPEIPLLRNNVDLLSVHGSPEPAHFNLKSRIYGTLAAVGSSVTFSTWMIIQTKMTQEYPHVYTLGMLMCLMGAAQSTAVALYRQKSWDEWKLGFNIRLLTALYAGVVASGLILTLTTWCMRVKGPLYVTVFNPLMLVIVAVLGSFLLGEKLHLGSFLGALLIVVGLYLVLWGKRKEAKGDELPLQKDEEPGQAEMAIQTQSGR